MSTPGIFSDAILDAVPDNALVTDQEGRLVQANARARRLLALGEGPFTQTLTDLFPFRDPDLGPHLVDEAAPFEDIVRTGDGREFRVLVRAGSGVPGRQVWLITDLTKEADDRQGMIDYMADLTVAQAKVREYTKQIEVFRQIVDGMDQGIVLTDPDQRVGFSNAYANQLFGVELTGRKVDDLKAQLQAAGSEGGLEVLKGEVLVLNEEKGRQTRCFLNVAPLSRTDAADRSLVWTFFELTEEIANTQAFIDFSSELSNLNRDLQRKNDEILRLNRTDPLTGVVNRKTILEMIDLARDFDAKGGRTALTVLLFRVEGIREVNQQWGHAAGDAVLKQVCTLAGAFLGDRGTIGRFGGAEFLVAAPGLDDPAAAKLALDLKAAVRKGTADRGQAVELAVAQVRHQVGQDSDGLLRQLTAQI